MCKSTREQLNIPGLQQRGCRRCVHCGRNADSFCAGCGVTPYCSVDCQRRDWRDRHKSVCHNLARLPSGVDAHDYVDYQPTIPAAQPLRRPRSPVAAVPRADSSKRNEDICLDKAKYKFLPPDHKPPNQAKPRNFRSRAGFGNQRRPQDQGGRNRQENDDQEDEDWGDNSKRSDPKKQMSQNTQHPSPALKFKKPSSQPAQDTVKPQSVPSQTNKPSIEPIKQNVKKNTESVVQKQEPVRPSAEVKEVKQPVTVADVTPVKKAPPPLVPNSWLIETLSVGDVVLLSVETPASQCRTSKSGYVCLSMHDNYESDYQELCEDYVLDCEADNSEYSVTPGETFSYFNPEDSGWYRARCLTSALAALLDGSKVVSLTSSDRCKRLSEKFSKAPEFCCVLDAKSVAIGQNLKCTIVSKTSDGYTLSIEDVESGASLGTGEAARWLPEVAYPQPKANGAGQVPSIPDVVRPPVRHNAYVLLVEAAAADRVLVRPADAEAQGRFEAIVQDVALFGVSATVLKEPPVKGSTVVAKFTDGLHYRALVRRTNVKQNKYLLEYIEYGNTEIVPLENIYPCPQKMTITTVPTEVSVVKIPLGHALTAQALKYLEDMKDQEFILTLPNGKLSAASGCEATLTSAKTKECVNTKLEEMCKPEWKKLEERGGDVIETKRIMYGELQHLDLPPNGCVIEVLDSRMLEAGSCEVTGCQKGLPHKDYIDTTLRQRMTEYCNSEIGREPYLPRAEELCIAKDTQSGLWHRAVIMEQESGAGGSTAQVYYIDVGYAERLPVTALRKILPEFVDGLPAVAIDLEITGFPSDPTAAMISRALAHMNRDGRREMRVRRCAKCEPGSYKVEVPELIDAMLKG